LDPSHFGPRKDTLDDFGLAAGDGLGPEDTSLYFTPEGTPLRDIAGNRADPYKIMGSLITTPAATAAAPMRRIHRKSKSFSHFLPSRRSGQPDEPSPSFMAVNGGGNSVSGHQHQRTVQAIIEHVVAVAVEKTASGDQLNIEPEEVKDPKPFRVEKRSPVSLHTEDDTAPLAEPESGSDDNEEAALVITMEAEGEPPGEREKLMRHPDIPEV